MQPNDNPPINGNATPDQPDNMPDDNIQERIDRLGGEAAPDITPEEFARLQQTGSLHIDSRGRIRANRRDETDPGLSLRKRRAWYSDQWDIHQGA